MREFRFRLATLEVRGSRRLSQDPDAVEMKEWAEHIDACNMD
jgi:hypothetical protein